MSTAMLQTDFYMRPPSSISLVEDSPIRLWHDDVRKPPPGWSWVRTNDAAKEILIKRPVRAISMDHDLGGHELDPDLPDTWLYKGPSTAETGLALVDWMIFEHKVPDIVYIHSWNGPGAMRMLKAFHAKGYMNVYLKPYEPPAQPICDHCGEVTCWRVGGIGGCGGL